MNISNKMKEIRAITGLTRKDFSDKEIAFFKEENIRLKKEFIQKADPEDLEKRRPQDELLNRIKHYQ